jgi:3-deoxy-7-phosphoheptulonate synthase
LRALVPSLARAGVVVGADGLLVEVHPDPTKAMSDGEQSLTFEQFESMMRDLQPYIELQAGYREVQAELTAVAGVH